MTEYNFIKHVKSINGVMPVAVTCCEWEIRFDVDSKVFYSTNTFESIPTEAIPYVGSARNILSAAIGEDTSEWTFGFLPNPKYSVMCDSRGNILYKFGHGNKCHVSLNNTVWGSKFLTRNELEMSDDFIALLA